MSITFPSVDVLLATYNGEKYLNEQIASVLNQTYLSLRLFIRDDGSHDSTPTLIRQWAALHPSKIILIPSDKQQGVKRNFLELMRHATSPYVMFCDQDDIWMKDKVVKSLALIQRIERENGASIPCLVHTDLQIVDQNLGLIADSFWNFAKLTPIEGGKFSRLLMQNVVTGCTMMMNRDLLNLIDDIPQCAVMHDWWISLVAAAFGQIALLKEPTVLYRQHSNNVLGAQKFGTWHQIKKTIKSLRDEKNPLIDQAKAFYNKYHLQLEPKKQEILNAYLSLSKSSWIQARYKMLRYALFKNGWIRNLAIFFLQK